MDPDRLTTIFAVKRTQVEMMYDRGNSIPQLESTIFIENPQEDLNTSLVSFVQAYIDPNTGLFSRDMLSQTYEKDGDVTYVYYAPETSKATQGVDIIKGFISEAKDLGATTAVIISEKGFTADARKKLAEVTNPIIQIFFDSDLYANPISHYFVPTHTKVSDEDKKKFFSIPTGRKKPPVKSNQVLVLSIDDPIVKYYGWVPGDLIRIERKNLTSSRALVQNTIVYRIVSRISFSITKNKKITRQAVK